MNSAIVRKMLGSKVAEEINNGYQGSYTVKIFSLEEESYFYLSVGEFYIKCERGKDGGFRQVGENRNKPRRKGRALEEESLILGSKDAIAIIEMIHTAGFSGQDDIFAREKTDEEKASYRECQKVEQKRLIALVIKDRTAKKSVLTELKTSIDNVLFSPPKGFLAVQNLPAKKREVAQKAIEQRRIEYPKCSFFQPPSWLKGFSERVWFIEEASLVVLLEEDNKKPGVVARLDDIKQEVKNHSKWFCISCGKEIQRESSAQKRCKKCLENKVVSTQEKFCSRCGKKFHRRPEQKGKLWRSNTICMDCWLKSMLSRGVFAKKEHLKDVLFIREYVQIGGVDQKPFLNILEAASSFATTIVLQAYIMDKDKIVGNKLVVFEDQEEIGRFQNEAEVIEFLLRKQKEE